MEVGQLFVSLGVKGSDKTVSALKDVKDGMKDIASTSLETKVAIIGAVYALERLFQTSGQRGSALENFSALTGMSKGLVQQYEWAARQVNVSGESIDQTFLNIQKNMANFKLGKGAPETFGFFQNSLEPGEWKGKETLDDWMKNPEKMLQVAKEVIAKTKDAAIRNKILEGMGISPDVISGLVRGGFSQETLKKAKAHTYSDKEIDQLDKANIGWKNLGASIEMMFGHLNAKHGVEFIEGINKMMPAIEKLMSGLIKLAEKMEIFKLFKTILEDTAKILDHMADTVQKLTWGPSITQEEIKKEQQEFDKLTPEKKKEKITEEINKKYGGSENTMMFKFFREQLEKSKEFLSGNGKKQSTEEKEKNPTGAYVSPKQISPNAPMIQNAANSQNMTINQELHFDNPGSNPRETASAWKREIQNTGRQLSSLSRTA